MSQNLIARLGRFAEFKEYKRKAAVYFPQTGELIPYPLQDNLRYLDKALRDRIIAELSSPPAECETESVSLKDWLLITLGPTLCELFFFPFNERYTAGLYADVVPQDAYKNALDRARVLRGARESTEDVGYNRIFHYPVRGLDHLIRKISAECTLNLGYQVAHIDISRHEILFTNGTQIPYHRVISTVPLDSMVQICEIGCDREPDPATAVLVVNIGATKNRDFSPYHWIYLPSSRSGIHRVGFYNHVDSSFLPTKYRSRRDVVSIYAERSYLSGAQPSLAEQSVAVSAIVEELKDLSFIAEPIVVSSTFTDPAYTWSRRGSSWAYETISQLDQVGINQIGRYGGWHFQGMLESFEQGLSARQSPPMQFQATIS